MEGNRDRRSVTVNLTDEFAGINASELQISVLNVKGAEVETRTITLATED